MKNLILPSILLLLVLVLFGCSSNNNQANPGGVAPGNNVFAPTSNVQKEKVVTVGDTVSVDYVGTLDNGTVFDTSIDDIAKKAGLNLRSAYSPMKVTVGTGQVIKGFDNALIGMKVNEEKNVHIEPKDAYGEYTQNNVITISLSTIQNGDLAKVGQVVYTNKGVDGTITKIENGNATINFNHPLAGKALNFKIILRSIE